MAHPFGMTPPTLTIISISFHLSLYSFSLAFFGEKKRNFLKGDC